KPLPFFLFSTCDGTTLHRRHRHHTPPLGAAPVPLEPPHSLLSIPPYHHLDPPPWSPKQPRNVAVWTDFYQTFSLSFSLIFPPNWTSKVLRPRIRSRRDPLRIRQCGTTYEWTLFSTYKHGYFLAGCANGNAFESLICSVIALARVEFVGGNVLFYKGDSAKIFGRKSRFLVSGPGIGGCR
ncbi:ZWICHEL kinesin-like calmodulin-binding protein, partial [Prunus dulcis]